MTKDASLTVRIEPDLKAAFTAKADAEGLGLSTLVVRTLRRAALRWNKNGDGRSKPAAPASQPVKEATNAASLPRSRKHGPAANG